MCYIFNRHPPADLGHASNVSKKAEKCPKCGAPLKRKTSGCAVLALFGFLFIGYCASQMNPENITKAVTSIEKIQSGIVSKSKFNMILNGMSYSEVVSIIGHEGTLSSSGHMDGVPGVMDAIDTEMYMWQNPNGSNMNATFQNDKLKMKTQFGLK